MSETTTPTDLTTTREGWLRRAVVILRPMILQVSGVEVPDFHVSMGFGGLSYERGVRGVCWHTSCSDDGRNHVFISPELNDTGIVLLVLLHEMLHVALNNEDGHKGRFAEYATRLGLQAPFTTATPDIVLTATLMEIAAELGEFPHGALHVPSRKPVDSPVLTPAGGAGRPTSGPGVQTNRWIVFRCEAHGTPVRMSRTKAALGAPYCGHRDEQGVPCLTEMREG